MMKVFCSEVLDWVVDENVQVFGGAGFVEDYPAERYWRDARVNRIYEGTNERSTACSCRGASCAAR